MQDLSEEEQLHATTTKLAEILDRRRGQYAQADIRIPLEASEHSATGASLADVASRCLVYTYNFFLHIFRLQDVPSQTEACPKVEKTAVDRGLADVRPM